MKRLSGALARRVLPFASAAVLFQAGTCTDESATLFAQFTGLVTASIVGDLVSGAFNLPNPGAFSF